MTIDLGQILGGGSSGYYILVDVVEVDCYDYSGTPVNWPLLNTDYGTVEWVVRATGGTSGGNTQDPNTPVPVDEGMPGDLTGADAFFWMMEHRIGTKIYFDEEEKEAIRSYSSLTHSIHNYVQQFNEKPDGSKAFKLSFANQQLYPKFVTLLQGLPSFVENDEKVRNALIQYTGYSLAKIKTLLKFGQGPEIFLVYQLRDRHGQDVLGLCDCDIMDKPSESKIQIKEDYVLGLERDNGILARQRATAFLLAVTVLHEFVHYSRNQNQLNDFSREFGESFEIAAFGVTIGRDNAGKLSYRLTQTR